MWIFHSLLCYNPEEDFKREAGGTIDRTNNLRSFPQESDFFYFDSGLDDSDISFFSPSRRALLSGQQSDGASGRENSGFRL